MASTTIGASRSLVREPPPQVWKATVARVKELLQVQFFEQGSSEWFAQRNTMLTASDVAAALGFNPYQTRKSLLDKKTGRGKNRAFTGNAATRWGTLYETEARKLYERKTGHFVYEFGVIPHQVHTWIGGSPDGVTATGRLLEIKVRPSCDVSENRYFFIPRSRNETYPERFLQDMFCFSSR